MLRTLPSDHFLSLPRPDASGRPQGVVDTTTLAAHDFDVDNRTGFMPPDPPVARLPSQWEAWEGMLDEAQSRRLQLGDKLGLTEAEAADSESWRARVREMPVLSIDGLISSEPLLRRAHHVLAWLMHFYIQSLPPSTPVIYIPRCIALPHLRVCSHLRLPPVVTYSDDVLYNWGLVAPHAKPTPSAHDPAPIGRPSVTNLRSLTLFTGTRDEEEFYLASARIELRGVDALSLMRATMDEAFVGDDISLRRIARYLDALVPIVSDLRELLLGVKQGVRPEVFYNEIRPWFRGRDADPLKRDWVFEGADELEEEGVYVPAELSGPSAGQSSLIHALDIFLGVDQYSPDPNVGGVYGSTPTSPSAPVPTKSPSPILLSSTSPVSAPIPLPPLVRPTPFMKRMHAYMPRHHRAFLAHLLANPRPLRALAAHHAPLAAAYNAALQELRRLRDAHMTIVALYIVGPARHAQHAREATIQGRAVEGSEENSRLAATGVLQGTGGTDLVKFLKGTRDRTASAVLPLDAHHLDPGL